MNKECLCNDRVYGMDDFHFRKVGLHMSNLVDSNVTLQRFCCKKNVNFPCKCTTSTFFLFVNKFKFFWVSGTTL